MGVLISWICVKNRKSVIAAIVFHFIINLSQEMLEITQVTKCIETLLLTAAAAAIIAMEKEMFFNQPKAFQNNVSFCPESAVHKRKYNS